ncbi:MAG: ROK family protein [Sedimentisphaerales bacterium]
MENEISKQTVKKSLSARGVVLRLIHETRGITAAEISRRTGIGTVVIKHHVDRLLRGGRICKNEAVRQQVGRPSMLLTPNPESGYLIGVDMDPARVTAVVIDKMAKIIKSVEYAIDRDWDGQQIIVILIETVKNLLAESEIPESKIEGVGFALTGFLDVKAGVVIMSKALPGWNNVPALYLLQKAFDFPVMVDTSIATYTLAEKWFGNGACVSDFVALRIRTTISLGIVINGELFRGQGNAGTINDLYVLPKNSASGSDEPQTLFELASGIAILNEIKQRVNAENSPKLWDIIGGNCDKINLDTVVVATTENDPLCVSVLKKSAKYWGRAMARVCELLHPQKVILTGPFAQLPSLLMDPFCEAMNDAIYPALRGKIEIQFSELGRFSAAMGAAALVLRESVHSE